MGSRKETRTRGFHSASAPFRQAYKRKASSSQQVRNWAQHTFTGEFNQSRYIKFFALTFVVLAIGGGLVVWAKQPGNGLFHSRSSTGNIQDPYSILWSDADSTHDTGGFNCITYDSSCHTTSGFGNDVLRLEPNGTVTSVAISRTTLDLSTVGSKEMMMGFSWLTHNTYNLNKRFGWFLTTNSTLPTQKNYDPYSDTNVVLATGSFETNAGCVPNCSFGQDLLMLRTLGQKDTLTGEDAGGCGSGGSKYICNGGVVMTNAAAAFQDWVYYLNFTGAASHSTACSINDGTEAYSGPGCSFYVHIDEQVGNGVGSTSSQKTPWLNFQSQQYYLGFYVQFGFDSGTNGEIYFSFDQNQFTLGTGPEGGLVTPQMQFDIFTPATGSTTPTPIDTGGFFGPIIKALISVGIFIAQNIINFLTFLYNLLAPLLAGAATIIGNVLTAVMNALGGIFGDNTLGTQISTAFSQIVGYLTNVFSSAVAIWGNILTALLNILNFVTQFLTITVSGGATLFNFIENFFSTLQNFWTVLVGVWNQFMKFYIAGTFTIQYILVVWWIWGMYENFKRGVRGGLIEGWLQPSETFLLALFKGGYWFLDEAYAFVVQLKQLIFGNRISPGTIAGNG